MAAAQTKRLVFHIGMPKCGSTYLQRMIFPGLRSLHYQKHSSGLMEGSLDDRLHYLEAVVAAASAETVLFSAESLCGHPANKATYDDFGRLLRRIPAKYAVTVIIVVRRQDSFIDSLYRHHIRKGGNLDVDQFFSLEDVDQRVADKVKNGSVHYSYCDYSRFLDYTDAQNISLVIIPFELMQEESGKFVEGVLRALNTSEHHQAPAAYVNRGASMPELVVQKWLDRVASRSGVDAVILRKFAVLALKVSRLLSGYWYVPARVLTDVDREKIVAFYRASNRRLAKVCGYDLAAFGYC